MKKKQTAVEWFEKQLDDLDIEIPFAIFQEAKEMEKEQIIDAYKTDLYPCSDELMEKYYNETFKTE